ncbi:hypothetical protein TanjilG_24475 [Lupinus angustifolius]|uniref:Reverse transcriptase Ty1/copia-type domain-containing protein n=2 Tax=Lupinus angustifolius TaxID=3871 RepID=A0A1J7IGX8_LUPAN|nr:hypothetical protein TanjilG_24475 [Lupinus angustifolius]
MDSAKSLPTPMSSSCKLTKTGSSPFDNPTLYRSIVGALQYATITRPDLAFSVNKVCQYMSNPLEHHWTAVKRILRYLQGSLTLGIQLRPASPHCSLSITAFCDADWASDPDDRKSVSGACLFVGPNIVTWWSKKQQTVSRSSTEAEYRSLALASQKLIWIESLLSELKFAHQCPLVLCDNLSIVAMAHNPILHHRTKHIELDLFFVRDRVQSNLLQIKHIPSEDQTADALTKPLSNSRFLALRKLLQVVDRFSTHPQLQGGILE